MLKSQRKDLKDPFKLVFIDKVRSQADSIECNRK